MEAGGGGTVAKWSKVLPRREKIGQNQEYPGIAQLPGQTFTTVFFFQALKNAIKKLL